MSSVSLPSRSRLSRSWARQWQLLAILALPLAWLVVFRYVPMYGLQIAFKNFRPSKGMFGSPWVGFGHFAKFFASPSSWGIVGNTVAISLYGIAASFPLAIVLALALNEVRSPRLKKTVQMITYAPYFISTVVLVSMVFQLLDPRLGIVNRVAVLLGGEAKNYMGDPKWFRHVYVWSGIWQSTGYNAIIYLAALAAVSPELYEAAVVDGCTKAQRIFHIDLPSIKPTIVVMLILNMGYVMSVGFEKAYLMQNPLNLDAGEVISTYIYRVGLINVDYSYSAAIGFVNSAINAALLLGVNAAARSLGEEGLF